MGAVFSLKWFILNLSDYFDCICFIYNDETDTTEKILKK
jgi:hypothetical protein